MFSFTQCFSKLISCSVIKIRIPVWLFLFIIIIIIVIVYCALEGACIRNSTSLSFAS
jgi:hypothetical protein